jgi:ATP/maltotriose-dependent transcriptional regulator MalT
VRLSRQAGRDPLDDARRALAEGEWTRARARFESALTRTDSAEAHEGLSWAAWWLSDPETLFRERERAYALYSGDEDRRGAARMAMWLASDSLEFRGEAAVASGWRRRAARLLQGLVPSAEHGWLAAHEGAVALEVEGAPAAGRRHGARAVGIGRRVGAIDIEVVGRAIEGLALVMEGRVAQGMPLLDEAAAVAAAGELRERLSVGWTFCYVVLACECVGDFDRAGEWCRRIEALARRLRFRYWRGVCHVHYATVLAWHGAWDQAETELVRAARDLAVSRPVQAPEAIVRLAELRRCQGRLDEAERLFGEAPMSPLATIGLARLALARGAPRAAASGLERLLRRLPPEARLRRAEALEVLIDAHTAVGQPGRARAALRALRSIARAAGTGPLRAAACRAEGVVAAADGAHERASRCFEQAVALFARSGAPFAGACARIELASSLRASDQPETAVREARAALATLERLGAAREVRRARALMERATGTAPASPLTAREREVLALVAKGLGDKQVAAALGLSPHTVHRHVANVLVRLGVSSRAAAVAQAVAQGLVAPWPRRAMPESLRRMA